MLSDLKAMFDMVDKYLEKRKVSQELKTRDKVLVTLHKLGNEGEKVVSIEELEAKGGFSKLQISHSIELLKNKNWIIEALNHKGMSWALTQDAKYYVEGLLEKMK
jgi:hypothetical protein